MAKKRRTAGRGSRGAGAEPVAASEARIKLNVHSYEDVADSEDEFFLNRDQVLLDEGPARKKLRKLKEDEAFLQPSDEEILSVPESDSQQDWSDDPPIGGEPNDGNAKQKGERADSSDAEDLAGWGSARRDYYDADPIETEADALEEEKEALRLQRKQLQGLKVDDYGFDETEWLQEGEHDEVTGANTGGGLVQEFLPELEVTETMTHSEKEKVLETRYPELRLLAEDMIKLQPTFRNLDAIARETLQDLKSVATQPAELSSVVLKRNALAAYLGAISMYFAILTSGTKSASGQLLAKSPALLREHPIMEILMTTLSAWEDVKDKAVDDVEHSKPPDTNSPQPIALPTKQLSIHDSGVKPKKGKSRKSKARLEAEEALKAMETQRAERVNRVKADLAHIVTASPQAPAEAANNPLTRTVGPDSDSDFGEAEILTAEEADEKARRKRGLRFYTSKITAKSLKRDRATREGGDTDIPYRERLKDRQARLNAAAEARGVRIDSQTALGADAESDDEDRATRAVLRGEGLEDDDDDDYYDLAATRAQHKKENKAAEVAARQAARIDGRVMDDGDIGPYGKREITYAMEKNKGLTPHRKKAVRNPRVKKRNKYEEKLKKLNNLRPTYKGGEGRGGYGGELTGIRKNLVKSVKL